MNTKERDPKHEYVNYFSIVNLIIKIIINAMITFQAQLIQ
jgi:hypothetical protein